jgi:hypothetical protein
MITYGDTGSIPVGSTRCLYILYCKSPPVFLHWEVFYHKNPFYTYEEISLNES